MKIFFETHLESSLATIRENFGSELFLFLKPPGLAITLNRFDGCKEGDEVHLVVNSLGLKQEWVSVMTSEMQNEKEWAFIDEGKILPWPLSSWKHIHRVVYLDDKSSKIIDDITYKCRYSWMEGMIYPILWSTFAIRPSRYRKFFQGR